MFSYPTPGYGEGIDKTASLGKSSTPMAPVAHHLLLLPSGPDRVRGASPHGTGSPQKAADELYPLYRVRATSILRYDGTGGPMKPKTKIDPVSEEPVLREEFALVARELGFSPLSNEACESPVPREVPEIRKPPSLRVTNGSCFEGNARGARGRPSPSSRPPVSLHPQFRLWRRNSGVPAGVRLLRRTAEHRASGRYG